MNVIKVIDHITNWLHEYCTRAGQTGFVVGVSGGVDSAVTSALCARTGLPTLCLEMPIHQSHDQVTRAQDHIARLMHDHAECFAWRWCSSHRCSTSSLRHSPQRPTRPHVTFPWPMRVPDCA